MELVQQLNNLDNNDNATNARNTFVLQKLSQGRYCQSRKRITFDILNEDMDDIIITIKLLEHSGGFIDGVAKT